MSRRLVAVTAATLTIGLALAGCSSSKKSSSNQTSGKDAKTAASAADLGGMDALVAAAKKEGKLNTIALPRTWANYGELIDTFQSKYGIKITNDNPDGSSGDEINAIKTLKSQNRAPDVVDVGQSFALSGTTGGYYAPYKVATWADIPDSQKDANGNWYNDYGGFISIGCDAKKVSPCPKSIKELNNPAYKGKVALNGDPTSANAAFSAVWAAALANGGSLDNIQPGIDFFGTLKKAGVFVTVNAKPATIESGETPIVLDWDYLNAGYTTDFTAKGLNWQVNDPTDALLPGYYNQAISKYAPHPAAARLWMEYLYSDQGQNLWLKGLARPARLVAMQKGKTAEAALLSKIPPVTGTPQFPTSDQITSAKNLVTQKWTKAVS